MDTFAKGFKVAWKIINDGKMDKYIDNRYASYESVIGKQITEKTVGLKELEAYTFKNNQIINDSGRQELLEAMINQYIFED